MTGTLRDVKTRVWVRKGFLEEATSELGDGGYPRPGTA
jgi:hypothetical protein